MPIINGKKMACEPCIRGHRSTTCNHARERVMVPVRKPGRPLNECPHPKGSNCHCRDLTVAIPRKRKCPCGDTKSSTAQGSTSGVLKEGSSPGSATPPADDQIKVAEPTQLAHPNPSAFVPTPPATYSSSPSLNGHTSAQWNANPSWDWNFGAAGARTVGPSFQGFNGAPAPLSQQPGVLGSAVGKSEVEVNAATPLNEPTIPPPKDDVPVQSSCCSTRRSSTTAQFASASGAVSPESSASSYTDHSRSSSKSRNIPAMRMDRPTSQTSPRVAALPQISPVQAGQASYPVMLQSPLAQFTMQPITAHPPACTGCGHDQPPILIYLPYGPPAQPVSYVGAGGPMFVVPPNGASVPPTNFPRNPPPTAITVPVGGCASDGGNLGSIHECHCGPGCQCIGCIAHPFNDATKEYIRSAQDAYEDFGQGYPAIPEVDSASVPTAQSMANLALSPEQTLGPEDFFFVDYPMTRGTYGG
ncbi:hypothetical protein JX266_004194 [Neoarthrinium moseri]|nr:hypothetical protein JX266_004194 [Neoarthrinium moseri]